MTKIVITDREFVLPKNHTWRRDRFGSIVTMYAHMLMFGPPNVMGYAKGPEPDTWISTWNGKPDFLVCGNTAWGLIPIKPDAHTQRIFACVDHGNMIESVVRFDDGIAHCPALLNVVSASDERCNRVMSGWWPPK